MRDLYPTPFPKKINKTVFLEILLMRSPSYSTGYCVRILVIITMLLMLPLNNLLFCTMRNLFTKEILKAEVLPENGLMHDRQK